MNFLGLSVYDHYRYRIKNIPPELGTHCKPIHAAFQIRMLVLNPCSLSYVFLIIQIIEVHFFSSHSL